MRNSLNKIIVTGIIAGMVIGLAWKGEANSPTKIQLTYDKEKKLLHVVVKHVAHNMRKHYIRKINVSRNDEVPVPYHFAKQTSADELIADVPLEAVANDVIKVKAICSEAGNAEESLVLPAE